MLLNNSNKLFRSDSSRFLDRIDTRIRILDITCLDVIRGWSDYIGHCGVVCVCVCARSRAMETKSSLME